MPIEFKDPGVAAKFTTPRTTDPQLHFPGGKNRNGWAGKLSTIPLEVAERLIKDPRQNLIQLKDSAKPAPDKKKEEKV